MIPVVIPVEMVRVLTIANVSERALAVLTVHGIVDILSIRRLVLYIVVVNTLTHSRVLPLAAHAFFVSSWIHFARDVGYEWSFVLHAIVLFLEIGAGDTKNATMLMFVFMLVVHIPCLCSRLVQDPEHAFTLLTVAVVAACAFPKIVIDSVYTFDESRSVFFMQPLHQIVVVAHILSHELI